MSLTSYIENQGSGFGFNGGGCGWNGGWGGNGGFGGFGLVGLVGLTDLFNRRRGGDCDDCGGGGGWNGAGAVVLEKNVSDLRREVCETGDQIEAAMLQQTIANAAQFNGLSGQIATVAREAAVLALGQQATITSSAQGIKDQNTAFQIANQENFCGLKATILADGAATRQLITQNIIEGLRAELGEEKRRSDVARTEVIVNQSVSQSQAQLQAQFQQQNDRFHGFFGAINDQLLRQANSVVNLGTMLGSNQNNQGTNIR
jgi:hypothetical protein